METLNSATARSFPPKLLLTPIRGAATHFCASILSNWLVFRLVRLCSCIRQAPSRSKVSKVNIFVTTALGSSRLITLCCCREFWNLTLTRWFVASETLLMLFFPLPHSAILCRTLLSPSSAMIRTTRNGGTGGSLIRPPHTLATSKQCSVTVTTKVATLFTSSDTKTWWPTLALSSRASWNSCWISMTSRVPTPSAALTRSSPWGLPHHRLTSSRRPLASSTPTGASTPTPRLS